MTPKSPKEPSPVADTLSGGESLPPHVVAALPAAPVSIDGEPPVSRPPARALVPTLRVVAGRDVLRFVTLRPGRMAMVGRDADCDLPLSEATVSRHHAVVSAAEDGTITVEDQNALNGTRINGIPVKRARLGIGEQLEVGSAVLRLEALSPEEIAHLDAVVGRLDAAAHDPMTGLVAPSWLDTDLPDELRRAQEDGTSISVVAIALDDIEGLRVAHGVKVADDALRVFSRLVLLSVRDTDACVRHGEGGALVIVHADGEAARKVAERTLGTLREHPWERVSRRLRVSVSAGIASAAPGESAVALLGRAAAALERAGRYGLSRVEVAELADPPSEGRGS